MKLFTTFQSLRFSLLKKENFNEKKTFQPENRRRLAHAVKNDRFRFFHCGFKQVGRATEKEILESSYSFALKEDFLFLCFDRRHFMQACSVFLHWGKK